VAEVLKLITTKAVLLCDEVDMLLHPLKSESQSARERQGAHTQSGRERQASSTCVSAAMSCTPNHFLPPARAGHNSSAREDVIQHDVDQVNHPLLLSQAS
jgi:hypothetical protein